MTTTRKSPRGVSGAALFAIALALCVFGCGRNQPTNSKESLRSDAPPDERPALRDPALVQTSSGIPAPLPLATGALGQAPTPSLEITTEAGATVQPNTSVVGAGPTLTLKVAIKNPPANPSLDLKVGTSGALPSFVRPEIDEANTDRAAGTFTVTISTVGTYTFTAQDLSNPTPNLAPPTTIQVVATPTLQPNPAPVDVRQMIAGNTYISPIEPGKPTSIRLHRNRSEASVSFTASDATRPVVLLAGNMALNDPDSAPNATGGAVTVDLKPDLPAGQYMARIVDRWTGTSTNATTFTLLASGGGSLRKPVVTRYSDTRYVPFSDISGTISVYGTFLQLAGQNAPVVNPLQPLSFLQDATDPKVFHFQDDDLRFQLQANPETHEWQAVVDVPQDLDHERHLFVVAVDGNDYSLSDPIALQSSRPTVESTMKPTITGIDKPDGSSAPATAINVVTDGAEYATSLTTFKVSGTGQRPDAYVAVFGQDKTEPLAVTSRGGDLNTDAWEVNVGPLSEETVTLSAVLIQGSSRSDVSKPVQVQIGTTGPVVAEVNPPSFGVYPGAQDLIIRFEGGTLDKAQAEDENNYKILPTTDTGAIDDVNKAVAVDDYTASFDESTNTVTIHFNKLQAGVYYVKFMPFQDSAGLRDVFGNVLKGVAGAPSGTFTILISQRAKEIAGAEPVIPPASKAPFVVYPEYNTPRPPTNGFNPSDFVETRVVRLYYYRDAHRVAQIVNRHVESYNRVAVDTRRRLATEKRREADQLTDDRKLQELKAIEAAKEAREAERDLAQKQSQLAAAQNDAANLPLRAQDLQNRLNLANNPPPPPTDAELAPLQSNLAQARDIQTRRQAALAAARSTNDAAAIRRAEVALAAANNNVARALNALQIAQTPPTLTEDQALQMQQELSRTQAQASQAATAAQALQNAVQSAQANLQAKREAEVASSQLLAKEGFEEDRAREEQFRLEVAAAHEDPDTYAPGKPESIDPVEQVTVSVIGEGLIQLRGPIKGINIIRRMINQIDAPAGQVRIGIHTVQINGEHGDRIEKVATRIQDYIDHARFLTMQSAQMLRNAVVKVASRRAVEAAAMCPDGASQEARDAKYVEAFFGEDFIRELRLIDSEFLQSGNKVLSLNSMDTTSLASALFMLALAKNETRMEILDEFQQMLQVDLPQAELNYLEEGGCREGHKHHNEFEILAYNARFQSFMGYFNEEVLGDDTLSPIQREFIRLAQVFKSYLVTEMELNQRVKERAIIEDRLGDYLSELQEAKAKEDQANLVLEEARTALNDQRTKVLRVSELIDARLEKILFDLKAVMSVIDNMQNFNNQINQINISNSYNIMTEMLLPMRIGMAESMMAAPLTTEMVPQDQRVFTIRTLDNELLPCVITPPDPSGRFPSYITPIARGPNGSILIRDTEALRGVFDKWVETARTVEQTLSSFAFHDNNLELLRNTNADFDAFQVALDQRNARSATGQASYPTLDEFLQILQICRNYQTLLRASQIYATQKVRVPLNNLLGKLADTSINASLGYRYWINVRLALTEGLSGTGPLFQEARTIINDIEDAFRDLISQDLKVEFAQQRADDSRRPLDHKKLLDMLIDEMEEKYIELLEGTRSHTAVVDGYIKALATALDDDFNTQFYYPAFRQVKHASRYWDVQLGQIESTNILTNNRSFAKVEPQATMEFDLPKRDILIAEAMNGAKALVQDYGALLTDPTFLSLAKLNSGQPTSSMMESTTGGGVSAVRNVLPGLPRTDDEDVLRQAGPGQRKFGSALEALIPDPAIYKFETGTGFQIRPVIQPDGQAVVFGFNYMYTTNVREPVRADEKHLGRVKRHFIDTDVQLSNYELREVSTYEVALKASRTSRGVPLFEDIPGLGILFRPLPSAESSLQKNMILAKSTIFPTLFDLMGLRWAPAVADLDTLRLRNSEFVVRGRDRDLENRVYDYSTTKVDDFLRIPPAERRTDLYRTQETIPDVHPNGYKGPGLNLRGSQLQEGFDAEQTYPPEMYHPADSEDLMRSLPPRYPPPGTVVPGNAPLIEDVPLTQPSTSTGGPRPSAGRSPFALPRDRGDSRVTPTPRLRGTSNATASRSRSIPRTPTNPMPLDRQVNRAAGTRTAPNVGSLPRLPVPKPEATPTERPAEPRKGLFSRFRRARSN